MPYMTRLVTITRFESVTEDLRPFVEFQAAQKKYDLKPESLVAILQVENIPSYYIIFLDSGITLEEVLKDLEKHELRLSEDTTNTLNQQLKEHR